MPRRLKPKDFPETLAGDWLTYLQKEATEGLAEFDRGEGIRGTADEHMARIDAAVRRRIAERRG